jgi:hypothetical protein
VRAIATTCAVIMAAALAGSASTAASALRPVVAQGITDGAPQLLVDGGQLLVGSNEIVLEFASSPRRQVDRVTLVARHGAASDSLPLAPDGPRRFHGTLVLAKTGSCRLQVDWWENGGHRTHTLTVPVVVGHH